MSEGDAESDAAVLSEAEVAGQARVLEIAAAIEDLSRQLLALHDSFPVSPLEAAILLGEEDLDVFTALRSVIEVVRADQLDPAVRELKKWAAYKPGKARK
jgi:hypothetical protein